MTYGELKRIVWASVIRGESAAQVAARLGYPESVVLGAWYAALAVAGEGLTGSEGGGDGDSEDSQDMGGPFPSLPRGLHIHGVPPNLSRRSPGAAVGLPRLSRRRTGARAGVPRAWRYQIVRRCGCTCQYCGRAGDSVYGPDCWPWHIDHIVPVARGGETTLDNLTLACRRCNMAKGTKRLRPCL